MSYLLTCRLCYHYRSVSPCSLNEVVAPIAQLLRIRSRMQEVRGWNPRLDGLQVSQLFLCPFVTPCVNRSAGHSVRTKTYINIQASGGIRTLQSRASGLKSTTQGIASGPNKSPPSPTKASSNCECGDGIRSACNATRCLVVP